MIITQTIIIMTIMIIQIDDNIFSTDLVGKWESEHDKCSSISCS